MVFCVQLDINIGEKKTIRDHYCGICTIPTEKKPRSETVETILGDRNPIFELLQ
jgi:hypothetical protein